MTVSRRGLFGFFGAGIAASLLPIAAFSACVPPTQTFTADSLAMTLDDYAERVMQPMIAHLARIFERDIMHGRGAVNYVGVL